MHPWWSKSIIYHHNINSVSNSLYCLQKNLKTKFKSKQVNQFQTILNEFKKISNSKVSTLFSILNSYTIFKGHVKYVMWTNALFTFWTQCYSSCKIWLDIYYTEFLTIFWFATLVNEYRLEIQFKKLRKVRNIQGRNLRGVWGGGGTPQDTNHPDWQGNYEYNFKW
jgi:hypothetical protein